MADLDLIERILKARKLPYSTRHVETTEAVAKAGDTVLTIVPRTELVFNPSGFLKGGTS